MTFHRLTVPSYFGGLPVGYDYVNNALAGTPSFAAGVKVGGPNSGTYFVAFGEDATSNDANRPARALAENTDILDDLLHRDIALPVRTIDVGPTGAPTSSVVITGPVFLGLIGAQLKDVFHVMNATDEDFDVGGVPVFVASITGGVVGTGFSAGNVTVTFNVPIPTGSTYHLYYGQRSNLATFPADGLTNVRIRNAQQVDFQLEEVLRQLHGNSEPWDAPWDNTIFGLNASVVSLIASRTVDEANIATNTANIATNTANIATETALVTDLITRRGGYQLVDVRPIAPSGGVSIFVANLGLTFSNNAVDNNLIYTTGTFATDTVHTVHVTVFGLVDANGNARKGWEQAVVKLSHLPHSGVSGFTDFGQPLTIQGGGQSTSGAGFTGDAQIPVTFAYSFTLLAGQNKDVYARGIAVGANPAGLDVLARLQMRSFGGTVVIYQVTPAIP